MNILDYVVLFFLGVSIVVGFYRGFVQTVLSVGGTVLSVIASFLVYPKLAAWVQGNEGIVKSLLYFTDASSRVGDLELSLTKVGELAENGVASVLQNVKLPAPLDTLLSFNLQNQVYEALGAGTVSEYVNQTILSVGVNIISFLVCFLLCFIVINIVINLIKCIFRFPILRTLDWLAGGAFGALRGLVLAYVFFTIVPLLVTVVPLEQFATLVEESKLAAMFQNGGLIVSIMNGKL